MYPSSGSVCERHTWAPWAGASPLRVERKGPSQNPLSPLPSSALIPGSGVHRSTNLSPALATRGTEEGKTRRRLPFCKRQPATPQKKLWFPSVSPQKNGRWGPAAPLLLGTRKMPSVQPRMRAWCKQQPLAGRPSGICFACWICVLNKSNSKAYVCVGWGRGTNNTKETVSSNVLCLVHSLCVSSYCFLVRKRYE